MSKSKRTGTGTRSAGGFNMFQDIGDLEWGAGYYTVTICNIYYISIYKYYYDYHEYYILFLLLWLYIYIYILHYITIVIEISGELPIIFRPGKEWHRIVTLAAERSFFLRNIIWKRYEKMKISRLSPVSLEHLGISRHWSLHLPYDLSMTLEPLGIEKMGESSRRIFQQEIKDMELQGKRRQPQGVASR